MNAFAVIILAALLLVYAAHLLADLLNLRSLSASRPAELADFFDDARYRTAREYTRTRTLFGLIASSIQLGAVLLFWFAGGFDGIDRLIRQWNLSTLWTGEIYIGGLVFLRGALSLPFGVYSTFVIEERFGFNRTTPATFIADLAKGFGLAVVLGGPVLFGVLALFEYAGAGAWAWCWFAGTAVIFFLQYVAPVWIMPLFNKFTPLENGALRDAIFSYASSVGFPLREVFVMDGSRRSGKSSAFFTGFGKNKRIALYDTLIAQHTVPELVAVLAHEIGHYKKRHVVQGLFISIAHLGVMLFLLSQFIASPGLSHAFFVSQPSVYTGLVFFGLLYTPVEFFLSLGLHALSRMNEYSADRYAAETTGDAAGLIVALKRLAAENLSNLTPHPFQVILTYSHPPFLERIQALKRMQSDALNPSAG